MDFFYFKNGLSDHGFISSASAATPPRGICDNDTIWRTIYTEGHLEIQKDMAPLHLPPYSRELSPFERLWEKPYEKEFVNLVFDSLGAAMAQAVRGLKRFEILSSELRTLTG